MVNFSSLPLAGSFKLHQNPRRETPRECEDGLRALRTEEQGPQGKDEKGPERRSRWPQGFVGPVSALVGVEGLLGREWDTHPETVATADSVMSGRNEDRMKNGCHCVAV